MAARAHHAAGRIREYSGYEFVPHATRAAERARAGPMRAARCPLIVRYAIRH